ncbi:MAG: hypothetical protein QOI66_1091 [Myxococcales bacterium]|nr:hypothetical protein [Myxococcales bacterium]
MLKGRAGHMVWLLSFLSSAARAEPPRHLKVVAAGTCPSAADVAQALQRLFPTMEISTAPDGDNVGGPGDAILQENAGGLLVRLSGSRRYFEDPTQRCADRTRLTAVFLAVVLDPPRFSAPAPPQLPAPAPAQSLAPALPRSWELELAPAFQVAPGAGLAAVPLAGGGGLRLLWGRTVRLSVGSGVLSSSTLHYQRADAHALWIPIDVGARLTLAGPRWDAAVEASLIVAPVHLSGSGLTPTESGWRAEIGERTAVLVRLWLTKRMGFFASIYDFGWPQGIRLTVAGTGDVGQTPRFWLGAQGGLVARLN